MNTLLLLISILVYVSFGIQNLFYILFTLFTSYFIGRKLEKNNSPFLLLFGISIQVVFLILFRVFPFFPETKNIVAPLGISYYTLQVVAYLVDVYKGKYESEKNFFSYALFLFYFPCLFIGPIHRYEDAKKNLLQKRKIKKDDIWNGLIQIMVGLFKKLVIAGRASIIVGYFSSTHQDGISILFSCLCYSILLYSDFSGGIDIVMGGSRILGVPLKENFDRPFLSETVKEFWRRWHIGLSEFLKDYIYIPLGGSKKGKVRMYFAVIITFLVSGLWHGVSYIFWGLMHAFCVLFSFKTKYKTLNRILTFFIVSLLWIFFLFPNPIQAFQKLGEILVCFSWSAFSKNFANFSFNMGEWVILLIALVFFFFLDLKKEKITTVIKKMPNEGKFALTLLLLLLVLLLGVYGIGFKVEEFIYSKF